MNEVRISESGIIEISGIVTIAHLENLYQEMIKIYNDNPCRMLDMSGVTEIDIAGFQMLLSFSKSLDEIGTDLKCKFSPAVDEMLCLTGLEKSFNVL